VARKKVEIKFKPLTKASLEPIRKIKARPINSVYKKGNRLAIRARKAPLE
jgi:hypothetical protein